MAKENTKHLFWNENKLQAEVMNYCRKKFMWDIRTPAGAPGVRDGSPDYIIPVSNGKVIFIEFKSPLKSSVTFRPFQKETILYLRQLGHVAFVTKDYLACKKVIDSRELDDIIINSQEVILEKIDGIVS